MASLSTYETDEAKLAPSGEGGPAVGVPSDSSLDPNVDSREIQGTHGEKAMSQGPGPQDNPQPQDPNQGAANVEGDRAILGLPFPRKLWMIVEDDTFASVRWNDDGDTVIIEEDLFQREVLSRKGAKPIFETDSLKTFIRLMNLYGFSKIRPNEPSVYSPGNKRMMMYRNCDFQRDKLLLIENIKRKGNRMTIAYTVTRATIAKRKKEVSPTRRSVRFHIMECTQEAEPRAQKEGPNAQGPSVFSGICSMGNMAGRTMEDSSSSEPGGPSGEGTSRNTMFPPMATAPSDDTGELPTRPLDYGSGMSLYNRNPIILAGLSVVAPLQAPEDDDDDEEGS